MKHKGNWFLLMIFFLAAEGLCHDGRAATVKGDTIRSAVRGYIETTMPWPAGTMRVSFPVPIPDVLLAAVEGGKITYQVRGKRGEDFLGDSAFTIEFYHNGNPVKEEVARVRMEVLRDIVVSSRVLLREREIGPDDIRVVKRWVREIPLNSVASPEEVIGKRICTAVAPHREITTNMLKNVVMIKKGKMVRIMLDNGVMRISGTGVAEENGAYGAIIKVKNASSHRTILARVEGDSLVQVDF